MPDDKLQDYIKKIGEYGTQQYIPGAYKGDVTSKKYLRSKPTKIIAAAILIAIIIYLIYLIVSLFQQSTNQKQVNTATFGVPTSTLQTTITNQTATTSPDVPDEYLNSKYRVIGTFKNFDSKASVDDIKILINQVQLVVVTDRRTDENTNDSQCGSIYTQPTCYFFIEPLYIYGAPKHVQYLGKLTHQGAFLPDTVKFIAPNNVEFRTADGDAGCFSDKTWQVNLSGGKFTQTDHEEGCTTEP